MIQDENKSDEDIDQTPKQSAAKKRKSEEREEHVQSTIKKLKERHGDRYTSMNLV